MIFVITHKIFDESMIDKKNYKILHVGKNENCKDYYLRDDSLDNISYKNNNYCELTGLYWIWKNYKENTNSIVGIMHYRRYFTTNFQNFLYTYFNKKPQCIEYTLIKNKLKIVDIIVPKKIRILNTVEGFYSERHCKDDLYLTKETIQEICPDYLDAYQRVMKSHHFIYANMMVCKRNLFNQYCEWLFSIMDSLEKKIDLRKYENNYQKRVFGFISERLLQVWIVKNNLSFIEFPVFNTEERSINIFQKNINRVKKLLSKAHKNFL